MVACKKQAARKGSGLTSRDWANVQIMGIFVLALLFLAPWLAVLVIAFLAIIWGGHCCKAKELKFLSLGAKF